ncbi:MAG: hypothetical protein KatS3mg065_0955 [Chloroflexota bacterium]|nr:MAG: hypothetical protein KatS3mg065_0955 [Chloroflexota bacterium]
MRARRETWSLVARRDGLLRTYRVSRIVGARATGERFERPPDFDLAATWSQMTADLEAGPGERPPYRVTLRLSAAGATELASILGEARARVALDAAGPADEDGWRRVVADLENPGWAHEVALRLADRAEVLAPAELRIRVATTARAFAARYLGG